MAPNTIQAHQRMVALLAKPGQAIIDSLTPAKAHLWHMGYGLLGEAVELLAPIAAYENAHRDAQAGGRELLDVVLDTKNITEELGDGSFYARAIYDDRGITRVVAVVEISELPGAMLDAAISYVIACGQVADVIKKYVVYNKPWNEDFQAKIELALSNYETAHAEICLHVGLVDDEVLKANLTKLLTGDRARFKDAVYSDEAAQKRQDKEPGE